MRQQKEEIVRAAEHPEGAGRSRGSCNLASVSKDDDRGRRVFDYRSVFTASRGGGKPFRDFARTGITGADPILDQVQQAAEDYQNELFT